MYSMKVVMQYSLMLLKNIVCVVYAVAVSLFSGLHFTQTTLIVSLVCFLDCVKAFDALLYLLLR